MWEGGCGRVWGDGGELGRRLGAPRGARGEEGPRGSGGDGGGWHPQGCHLMVRQGLALTLVTAPRHTRTPA
jgi:hypothetical protein